MAGFLCVLDPTADDASATQLDITDNVNYFLRGLELPPPGLRPQYAQSADTEGAVPVDLQYENRKDQKVSLRVTGTSATNLETKLDDIYQKIGKFNREGGVLGLTSPSGTVVYFDILPESEGSNTFDASYARGRALVELTFVMKPFWRQAEITLSDHVETTLPYISFTETGIKGDVPGLGRLVIDEDQASQDQWWLIWGQESRYYSSSANAALFYEAEGRTAQGGSATAAGPSGASGSGSNVMRNTALPSVWGSILSTQATGGGAHLSHIGDFQVFARVQTASGNTGAVTLALEWAEGDFLRVTRNASTTFPVDAWDATWRLVDLGQVHLGKVATGTQRWEGRILAKSTVEGDDIDIDYLMLVPISEGSGRIQAVAQLENPTTFLGRDGFSQSGALNGLAAPLGGNWATSGTATGDFNAGSGVLTRTTTNDLTPGRLAVLGSTSYTAVAVQADMTWSVLQASLAGGLLARYVDASNWFQCWVNTITGLLDYRMRIAGSTVLYGEAPVQPIPGVAHTMRVLIDATGRLLIWFFAAGSGGGEPVLVDMRSELATGGALATGKPGLIDINQNATAATRTYDNFAVFTPTKDAAVFASQSIEVRHDRVIREDSGGTIWSEVSKNEGDYLYVPPAGKEGRTLRMIAKFCRNDPTNFPDSGIDDISARLSYRPRGLVAPEA
jgi:hypothetical protein